MGYYTIDDDYYNNAKLAISIARKLGATIFLVPEDIVEVRAKMVSDGFWSPFGTYNSLTSYYNFSELDVRW